MEETAISTEHAESTQLGKIGDQLNGLTGEMLDLIATQWDEKTLEIIKRNGAQLVAEAEEMKIETAEEYAAANEFFVSIAQYKKKGEGYIEPFVETFRQPWSVACDIRNQFTNPANSAKETVEKKIVAYKAAERRRAEEEQKRLDAERKRREAEERAKKEAKAREEKAKADKERREAEERARIQRQKEEAEAKRKREAEEKARKAEEERRRAEEAARLAKERQDADAAAAAQAEADRIAEEEEAARREIAEAEKAELAAKQKAAREIEKGEAAAQMREQRAADHLSEAESVFVAPTIAAPKVSKTETTAKGKAVGQKDWDVSITDELELVKAVARGVADGGFPLSVLGLDAQRVSSALKRWAKVSLQGVQRYEKNGVLIEATERLSARASTKKKQEPEPIVQAIDEPAPVRKVF